MSLDFWRETCTFTLKTIMTEFGIFAPPKRKKSSPIQVTVRRHKYSAWMVLQKKLKYMAPCAFEFAHSEQLLLMNIFFFLYWRCLSRPARQCPYHLDRSTTNVKSPWLKPARSNFNAMMKWTEILQVGNEIGRKLNQDMNNFVQDFWQPIL